MTMDWDSPRPVDLRPFLPDVLDENLAHDLDEADELDRRAAGCIQLAGGFAVGALINAIFVIEPAFVLIAVGAWFSFRAIAHTNRADSILHRSLAASLVEEGPGILSEAA